MLAVFFGFLVLVKSADVFSYSAIAISRLLHISPFFIAITLIPLGTSAPELFVSIVAALDGAPLIATGNVIGSNIINITLGIGIAALLAPIIIPNNIFKLELPVLLFSTLILGWMLTDLYLSIWEGVLFIVLIVIVLLVMVLKEQQHKLANNKDQSDCYAQDNILFPLLKQAALFMCAAIILYIGSDIVVWGASGVAEFFGLSKFIVGLTIVAIGTSLPEITVSAINAIKGRYDVVIGNIIGSNNINLLMVLGSVILLQPHSVPEIVLLRDYPVLIASVLLLVVFCYSKIFYSEAKVGRLQSIIFIALYLLSISLLFIV